MRGVDVSMQTARRPTTSAYLDAGFINYHKNKLSLLTQHENEQLSMFADLPEAVEETVMSSGGDSDQWHKSTYPMDIFSNGYMILLKT
jgi:hypothetical protein